VKVFNKKRVLRTDIVDVLWDSLEKHGTPDGVTVREDTSWGEYVILCCENEGLSLSEDNSKYLVEGAVRSWLWEKEFIWRKPVRSMEWLFGEHVMLYDTFGCKEHHVIVTTYDDSRIVWNSTVLCPVCNKENFFSSNKAGEYRTGEYPLEWKIVSNDEEWSSILKYSQWSKKYLRRSNFKFQVKQLFRWKRNWSLLKYRLKKLLKRSK